MVLEKIHILAFAGSLRKHSYNKMLLRAAQQLTPDTVEIEIFDLAPIPLYNMDLETSGVPEAVNELRVVIGRADAILMAVPEHNGTISAVLKNAIEWVSRRKPAYREYTTTHTPFFQKPVAFVGAATSHFATIRAQTHLIYVCSFLEMLPMSKPSLMLANAQHCFDEEGNLIDETAKKRLKKVLVAFYEWIEKTKGIINQF